MDLEITSPSLSSFILAFLPVFLSIPQINFNPMSKPAWVAIKKIHTLGGLNNRNFPQFWKLSNPRSCWQGRCPSTVSSPALYMAATICCMLTWPLFCMFTGRERMSSLMSLFIKALILSGQGPTLLISLNLNYFLRGSFSNTATLEV